MWKDGALPIFLAAVGAGREWTVCHHNNPHGLQINTCRIIIPNVFPIHKLSKSGLKVYVLLARRATCQILIDFIYSSSAFRGSVLFQPYLPTLTNLAKPTLPALLLTPRQCPSLTCSRNWLSQGS